MTRHGKCETCRKRKVKCDEKWPTCGPCSIKDRSCHYSESIFVLDNKTQSLSRISTPKKSNIHGNSSDRRFSGDGITLRLKRHRKAQMGQGEFLLFEPVKLWSPSPAMLCPQTRNAISLGSIFGYEALDLSPLGPWVRLAWPNSDSNPCLELASQYAHQSMVAFQHSHSEESLKRASRTGLAALQSLQSGIESCQDDRDKESLVIAVMLHYAAEHFLGIASWRYIPHLQGVCHLLKSFFRNRPEHASIQNVVSLICDHEIVAAIHFGEPSQLEEIARPRHSLEGPPRLDLASRVVDDLLIRIPRLVCLVRACVQDPFNLPTREDVIALVGQLHGSEQESYVEKTIAARSWNNTSVDDQNTSPTGTALVFDSLPVFVLTSRYHLYRLLLGGLLVTLSTISPNAFNEEAIKEAETIELTAATSLAECLDFALKPSPAQSLTIMAMILPLEISLGAWHRLQHREASVGNSPKYQEAGRMASWCIEHLQGLCSRWRAGPIPRNRMEAMYGVFVGGPLLNDAYDYRKGEDEILRQTLASD